MNDKSEKHNNGTRHTVVMYIFVFFSGFANLATEIIGPRLFASLFGTTTLIWAAIISVTLLGISLGYYLGGWIPRERIPQALPIILIVNAFWLLAISWLIWMVPGTLLKLGFSSVLLIAGLAFVVPAMLFSMASPLSITWLSEDQQVDWITRLVGNILAIGTVGSILGALVAAFYLIPWVGLTTSLRIFSIGCVLFALYFLRSMKRSIAVAALAVCLLLPQPTFRWVTENTLLEQREGYYQTIRVYQEGDKFLYFHLGPTFETIFNIETGEPGFSYALTMIELMEDVDGKEVLIIGGAGHTLAHALEKRGAVITEVEIDPFVVQLSDRHFGPIQGDVVVHDGRIFVDNAGSEQYHYVLLDAFNGVHYIPPQLTTIEFFQSVRRL